MLRQMFRLCQTSAAEKSKYVSLRLMKYQSDDVLKTWKGDMSAHLYMLSLNTTGLKPDQYEAQTAVSKGSDGQADILHRFKITGVEKLLLVVQESEANGVDTLIRERFPGGLSVDSSTPVIPSETFAERMQLSVPEGSPVPLDNGRLIWFEINIGYPGRTHEELLTAWSEEAIYARHAMLKIPAKLYTVVGERKVHVFLRVPPETADAMSFDLPLVKHLGDSIQIRTKGALRY